VTFAKADKRFLVDRFVRIHSSRCAFLFLIEAVSCGRPSTMARNESARAVDAPTKTVSDSVRWITINADSGVLRAAIARPAGPGPFPTAIMLHGTHGFAEEYVTFAKDLARQGVLGIAACWFEGSRGLGARFITPIPCPGAPRVLDAEGAARFRLSRQILQALVNSVKQMPDVRGIALFGQSRGGGAALDYALQRPGSISALVLNSTGYPPEMTNAAAGLDVPVLILHGVADNPADGGSSITNIEMARRFEAALRAAGKQVEVKYYEGGGHNSLFTSPAEYADAVQRISTFLHRVLPQ